MSEMSISVGIQWDAVCQRRINQATGAWSSEFTGRGSTRRKYLTQLLCTDQSGAADSAATFPPIPRAQGAALENWKTAPKQNQIIPNPPRGQFNGKWCGQGELQPSATFSLISSTDVENFPS